MRRWVRCSLAALSLVPSSALMQEKGGEDEFGPYEVVPNWPQPIPGTEGMDVGIDRRRLRRNARPRLDRAARHASAEGGREARHAAAGTTTRARRTRSWMHSVIVVDRNGQMMQSWPQPDKIFAQKGARGPHKIKMNPYDPQKHVWIMDDNLHQIFKFTYDGKLVQTLGRGARARRRRDATSAGRPTSTGCPTARSSSATATRTRAS